ncbi:hypothetical protein [Streptomyces fulvorobeus]|uniref:Lipoprotein n=1 Tax=Streptomyces fulvorobeus TaxID=284028 RepID=A0A7J0C9X0_9ACTN|nr:hypothetical protein [Streptomyces fulvorobeus]NYE42145.1 hypothetical protein [Streptomyces fulvorobeus]GFM98526.1 lipoprotein [Streptomyces fulvorobeus]
MRATAVRRTALAASVAALTLLATACGGSEPGGSDDAMGGAEAGGARKPAVKALTAAELEKASLAQGDVKAHKITKAGPEDAVAAADVTSDKEECAPLARAFYGAEEGKPVAGTKRQVISEPEVDAGDVTEGNAEDVLTSAFDLTSTLLSLSSYDSETAEGNIATLRKAAADCAGGFTITMGGDTQKVTGITEEKVSGGEEALAWRLSAEQDGESAPLTLVALRQGGTVATFTSFNLAAAGGKGTLELPSAVVAAQAAKLA